MIINSINYQCDVPSNYTKEILNDFTTKYLSKLNSYDIVDNETTSKLNLEFLNNDFNTNAFSQFCSLKRCNFQVKYSENSLQLGIIEITFNSSFDLKNAKRIVEESKRTNFKLKVLTKFIFLEKENSLIFVFSETPHNSLLCSFFDEIKGF
ncbi:hypothetical protein CSW08_09195 [Confluentibacter flavum]|uniref:Uncharacterized protein n=2 Tax=Confluentibacter flavum TaxID=1909700 RepID=A0A2N3HJS5_9FLAO|nr:hypothetical protein CSW08_09195 [Confluentibacter flavum]